VEEQERRGARDNAEGAWLREEDKGVAWPKTLNPRMSMGSKMPSPKSKPLSRSAAPKAESDWSSKTWGKAVMDDGRAVRSSGTYDEQPSRSNARNRSRSESVGGRREEAKVRGDAGRSSDTVRPAPWERARPQAERPLSSDAGPSKKDDFSSRWRQAEGRPPIRTGAEVGLAAPKKKASYERESGGDGEPAKELPSTSNANVLLGRSLQELTAFAVDQGEVGLATVRCDRSGSIAPFLSTSC
jgi:hypothetical protein